VFLSVKGFEKKDCPNLSGGLEVGFSGKALTCYQQKMAYR